MKQIAGPWSIHWFRRDLRVFGNAALRTNFLRTHGNTLGIFCFDSKFLARKDFSHHRFAFFLKTLRALKEEFRTQGGDLLVIDALPQDAFPKLFSYFKKKQISNPDFISWNRDYEPYARERDGEVAELLQKHQVEAITERDHLILEPQEVLKSEKPGDFYQVFTPYSKKWLKVFSGKQNRLTDQKGLSSYISKLESGTLKPVFQLSWKPFLQDSDFPFQDACEKFEKENTKHVTIPIPDAGIIAAFQRLKEFKKCLTRYETDRDFPATSGTSRLSIFFKNGSLTPAQALAFLGTDNTKFTTEIIWREFYYSILYHRPDVEHTSFNSKYADLQWENSKKWLEHWKNGTTGFPIVDAGMRELKSTGWMHNRVRMIVASFLTKDLLIDWRQGENHFMKELLDGDLAPNNGGWQWAASTGCDPQPYFRIFNPWLQSKRFDPDGEYIRRYIPELKDIPTKDLHDEEADRGKAYPTPIVTHSTQSKKAVALYKKA